MSEVVLIVVPYDGSHRNTRMGRGPLALLGPLRRRLEALGRRVSVRPVETQLTFGLDAAIIFDLARSVRATVGEALSAGSFPIVLSGNCASALGTVAALQPGTGVIWYDAHGDLHTPDTTE